VFSGLDAAEPKLCGRITGVISDGPAGLQYAVAWDNGTTGAHVQPYGEVKLNMSRRLALKPHPPSERFDGEDR
jgi:hypothetical protein